MIVGTAGHVDHGKTTLVKALTGVDTDRLPEEKARGISIDLGYAYAPLDNGEALGFVDVPGHERFVHTMLAGATGIDFALLVVAADDGVMPQTREHLHILNLLGVAQGAIALTKIDLVDGARLASVEAGLRALVAGTPLAEAPVYRLSARSGEGVAALRAALEQEAMQFARACDDGHFRLAVDRCFTLSGVGTVVTGTVHAGEVRIDDRLSVAPSGHDVRVRSLHAQNRPAGVGTRGERCALNLAGVARDEIARGDWIVAPAIALATDRFDGRLTLLADEERPLVSGGRVHLHAGAAHVGARVVALDDGDGSARRRDDLAAGATRLVQFVLERPIGLWHDDRFIIRDASATRTIGGGRVLDPFAPARYRRSADRMAILGALQRPTPRARIVALVDNARLGVDLARLARACNLRDVGAHIEGLPLRRIRTADIDYAIGDEHWRALQASAVDALSAFHATHPDELGPDRARLRRIAFPRLDAALYQSLIADLIAAGKVRRSGPWLHLPQHDNAPSAQERALLERIAPRLLDAPFDPPWVRELAKGALQPESIVRTAMIRASKRGEMYQVVRDLFYHPAAMRDLMAIAQGLQQDEGEVRAARFRDATHLGRKRAIQILEFFDRIGYTRRVRDKHIVRADTLLGSDLSQPVASGAIERVAS